MNSIVTITIACITINNSNLKLNKLETVTTMFYIGNMRYWNVFLRVSFDEFIVIVVIVCITINNLNLKLNKLEIVTTMFYFGKYEINIIYWGQVGFTSYISKFFKKDSMYQDHIHNIWLERYICV